MTEFELKQAALLNTPKIEGKEYQELLGACAGWYVAKDQYLMLLSKESGYYTIFNSIHKNIDKFIEELHLTLDYLGDIKSAELFPDRIEFWIQREDTVYCYILFDYTGGVIEIE